VVQATRRPAHFHDQAAVEGLEHQQRSDERTVAASDVNDLAPENGSTTSRHAILGGMGRTRNGSYAELVTVPASNVVPVSTSLSWTGLVALTEVYATAWAGLHQSLGLQPRRTVLVRGATLSLGQIAGPGRGERRCRAQRGGNRDYPQGRPAGPAA
jgi:hypothetical protein